MAMKNNILVLPFHSLKLPKLVISELDVFLIAKRKYENKISSELLAATSPAQLVTLGIE